MLKELKGRVTSGVGEGARYVSMPVYNLLLTELIDEVPYPGTLNIIVESSYKDIILECKPLQIKSVVMNGNEYGGFYYWFGKIVNPREGLEDDSALIVRPFLTTHPENVIEVIASSNLRRKLRLRDGDAVIVKLICAEV